MVQRRQPRYTQSKTYGPRTATSWKYDPSGAWATERGGPPRFADLNEARSYLEVLGLKCLKLYWIPGGVVHRAYEHVRAAPPF